MATFETVYCLTCGKQLTAVHHAANRSEPAPYTTYLDMRGQKATECEQCGATLHLQNVTAQAPHDLPADFDTLVDTLSMGGWYGLLVGDRPDHLVTAEQSPDQETIAKMIHAHRPSYALLLSFAARVLAADLRSYSARLEREQRAKEPDTELQREGYVSGLALLEEFVTRKRAELAAGALGAQ